MITLTVISYNGKPSPAPMSANFDEFGGTIGRADNNLLVLPDQERTVSRIHAQIVCRNGRFALVDRGSNPVLVNGRVLGNGREVTVSNGTELRIGGYVLKVQEGSGGARKKTRDPFSELFGPAKAANGSQDELPVDPSAAFKTSPGQNDPEQTHTAGRSGPRGPSSLPAGWDLLNSEVTARRRDPIDITAGGRSAVAADLETHWPGRPTSNPNQPPASPYAADSGAPVARPSAPPSAAPSQAVYSWDDPDAMPHTVVHAGGRKPASQDSRSAPRAGAVVGVVPTVDREPARASAPAPAPAPLDRLAQPAPVAGSADPKALLAAFLDGLAAPTVRIDALTPELMALIGQLLNACASGAVELLLTRAAVKRDMRATPTMLVARENNPLKFSPSGEAALGHLLSAPAPGFMPAVPAVQDAFKDLSAHHAGFAAGMRAALEGVLSRFDPAALEARLVQRSVLQSLVPGKRQSRMWEAFGQYYAQIRQEATDDFQTLLGEEFLKAYDDYLQAAREGDH